MFEHGQHPGMDIQQMDEDNGILPELIVPAAKVFAIKDVAECQRAFSTLDGEKAALETNQLSSAQ